MIGRPDPRRTEIERLVVELYSLNLEQQNHLWGYLGGKYLPSVVYKVRLVRIQEDAVRGEARPIHQRDFKRALKQLRPSTRPWFEMARNYALFDAEGGAYDDLIAYLRRIKMA